MSEGEHDRQRLLEALCQRTDLGLMGEVLGGFAHELNNALGVVNGNAEILLSKLPDLPADADPGMDQLLRDVRTVARWAETATDVAGRLASFSRRLREERQVLEVGALVRESAELIRYRCEREGILLLIEADVELRVVGVFGELQQALLNLIQNSREAITSTPREDEDGVIHVTVESDDSRVRISVTDDGPGIPPEVGDSVFEPFYTTRNGTGARGLGLALSRAVAERYGGTLRFAAAAAGACVVLELPLATG